MAPTHIYGFVFLNNKAQTCGKKSWVTLFSSKQVCMQRIVWLCEKNNINAKKV